jgi:hypothetical protein
MRFNIVMDHWEIGLENVNCFNAVTYWLRQYATSRKVADSRPNEVKFFDLPNPSGRALGFTQPLTEMGTRSREIVSGE